MALSMHMLLEPLEIKVNIKKIKKSGRTGGMDIGIFEMLNLSCIRTVSWVTGPI